MFISFFIGNKNFSTHNNDNTKLSPSGPATIKKLARHLGPHLLHSARGHLSRPNKKSNNKKIRYGTDVKQKSLYLRFLNFFREKHPASALCHSTWRPAPICIRLHCCKGVNFFFVHFGRPETIEPPRAALSPFPNMILRELLNSFFLLSVNFFRFVSTTSPCESFLRFDTCVC